MKIDIARKLSLESLYKIDEGNGYSNIVLDEVLKNNKEKINGKDVGFISELVYGVTTWRLTLDTIIQKYADIKIKKMSKWVINILRLGAYQILFLDKVPVSAAVNESVNLSKKYASKSAGFINAILRKIKKEDYLEMEKIKNDTERISKVTSTPVWIIDEILKEYNIQEVDQICRNLNGRPNLTIRVNKLKTNKTELISKLKEKDIIVEEGQLEDFLYLQNVRNITNLDLYRNGFFTIQDESAGLAAMCLEPKEGEDVLDCCSAPGGKTTFIAEIMNNKGNIVAGDLYENRLKLVEENSKRLGINIIKTKVEDCTILNEKYLEKFDKILMDVPCMGIGVIKRKPDIKWQKSSEDIENINKVQYKILNIVSKYLKSGGSLIYSTCSIFKRENEDIIDKFLKENSNFFCKEIDKENITNIKCIINKNKSITILPKSKNDGFYVSNLQKK